VYNDNIAYLINIGFIAQVVILDANNY